MQVNHEEVDTVLNGRRKRIESNMMHMQRGVEIQSEGWSQVRVGSFCRKPGGCFKTGVRTGFANYGEQTWMCLTFLGFPEIDTRQQRTTTRTA